MASNADLMKMLGAICERLDKLLKLAEKNQSKPDPMPGDGMLMLRYGIRPKGYGARKNEGE